MSPNGRRIITKAWGSPTAWSLWTLLPDASVNDVTTPAPSDGTATALFTVKLNEPASVLGEDPAEDIEIAYNTVDGTAKESEGDYVPTSGTLTFSGNQTQQTVAVTVNPARFPFIDRYFKLKLHTPDNATIVDAIGLGTITSIPDEPGSTRIAFEATPAATPRSSRSTTTAAISPR